MTGIIFNAFYLLSITNLTLATVSHYVYEFGSNYGETIFKTQGKIILARTTVVDIPVSSPNIITYAKVSVHAVSPPKVHYDSKIHKVKIAYSWGQIPTSTYEVLIKGFIKRY